MPEVSQLAPDTRNSLERLVASPALARAPRVHAVLTFLVGELLAGRAETVNEQRIGEGAFGRPAGYNPAEDNIVRVTVAHLRARLEEYYRAEGVQESWILEIPKGRYVPTVRFRDAVVDGPELKMPSAPRPSALEIREPAAVPARRGRHRNLLVGTVVAVLAVTNLILAYSLLRKPDSPAGMTAHGLLPRLFQGRTTPLTVVVTDENLMAYRRVFGETVLLPSYLNLAYTAGSQGDSTAARALEFVRMREATSTASATVAVALQAVLQPYGVRVRHPAEVSMPDFENDSMVLLGGPWVNPWVQLLEDKLNFRTYAPPGGALSEIHNAHPEADERAVYAAHTENGIEVSYLRVAIQPNHTGRGRVVLMGGIRGASQEAACNLLTDPARLDEILGRLSVADVFHLPPFELLLEVRGVSHTPLDLRIVAQRPHRRP